MRIWMSHRETSGSVILKLRISYDSGCHIVTNHILFASVLSMVKHKLYGQSFDRLWAWIWFYGFVCE